MKYVALFGMSASRKEAVREVSSHDYSLFEHMLKLKVLDSKEGHSDWLKTVVGILNQISTIGSNIKGRSFLKPADYFSVLYVKRFENHPADIFIDAVEGFRFVDYEGVPHKASFSEQELHTWYKGFIHDLSLFLTSSKKGRSKVELKTFVEKYI